MIPTEYALQRFARDRVQAYRREARELSRARAAQTREPGAAWSAWLTGALTGFRAGRPQRRDQQPCATC